MSFKMFFVMMGRFASSCMASARTLGANILWAFPTRPVFKKFTAPGPHCRNVSNFFWLASVKGRYAAGNSQYGLILFVNSLRVYIMTSKPMTTA